uniref:FACT complex subunit n=1 Tax=Tetraselmis sp. GSL018 TaxID=582737 RepID=A0A061QN78_9CHLO
MSSARIDVDTFCRRLKKLYESWQKLPDVWEKADSICVAAGPASEDFRYLKSVSLHIWLFGYELPETVIAITKDRMFLIASKKKAEILQPLCEPCKENVGVSLELIQRQKSEDGSQQVKAVLQDLKGRLGILSKEKPDGTLAQVWSSEVAKSGLQTVDVSQGISELLSVKEDGEVKNIKRACYLLINAMKGFVVPELEGIIDEEKKVKHTTLSEKTEQVLLNPGKLNIKLRPENVDMAYLPVFQSGGRYDLKLTAQSEETSLHYSVICASVGARYASYCANVARTYMVDPSKEQEQEYKAVLAAQQAAIEALVDGASMCDAHSAVVRTLEKSGQGRLVQHLTKNVGHGMGLELRESSNILNAKNTRRVCAGMVFNVCIGIQGLTRESKDPKRREYAIQIADTVVVQPDGKKPEVCSGLLPSGEKDVIYMIQNDDEENEEPKAAENGSREPEELSTRRKELRSVDPSFNAKEAARRERQVEILKQKNQETLRRLTEAKNKTDTFDPSKGGRRVEDIVAYKSVSEVPQLAEMIVQTDVRRQAVLLPIYGVHVPFHICTIKSIDTSSQEGESAIIRVTFHAPGAASAANYDPAIKFPNKMFIKELCFHTTNISHATKVVQEIKIMSRQSKAADTERAERATLVKQEKLVRAKNRVYRLPDLWIRPSFGGKGRKVTGTLECHQNGFRYTMQRTQESVDVMFNNIKHAFFQPAENEMITILHFHLKDPIMIGKKKTNNVQFYAEVMEVVQTLDNSRRTMHDPDEIEEEQREVDRRNKINSDFQTFVKRVQESWERDHSSLDLEFDIPFRDLGFNGVANRSTAFIIPTTNCLVELVEPPFLVVTLDEIEVVNFERVGFNLKNFDMAIIFKDFSKDVLRIDSIPSQSLDTLREWLTSVGIKYYESRLNLNWKPILKNIISDPEDFIANGGWAFLDMEGGESEEEGASEESEAYEPSDDGAEEEDDDSDDDSDDDASVVDSDEEESGEEEELDSEEEEGKDWDELEREAERADRERGGSDDSDDERRQKKRKGGGGGGKKRGRY